MAKPPRSEKGYVSSCASSGTGAALLINRHTTMAQVAQFADDLPVNVLKDVLYSTRLEARVKSYLKSVVQKRTSRQS